MGRSLSGAGAMTTIVTREMIRDELLDPGRLARAIPGAQSVEQYAVGQFKARLLFGVGPLRSIYTIQLAVAESVEPFAFAVSGFSVGGSGNGRAAGQVRLSARSRALTTIEWQYSGDVGGPVALAGGALLRIASHAFCSRFFSRLIDDLTDP